jgi:hypothetical protein
VNLTISSTIAKQTANDDPKEQTAKALFINHPMPVY